MVEAIVPFLVVHQGCDAKGPKDLPPAKTFGIWGDMTERASELVKAILAC